MPLLCIALVLGGTVRFPLAKSNMQSRAVLYDEGTAKSENNMKKDEVFYDHVGSPSFETW